MNYLRNKLVPTEIRNDINSLKSNVSEINTRLTGLERAQQSLNQQLIKSVTVAKQNTLFEPKGSLLDQIKKGQPLRPTQPKKPMAPINSIRPNDVLMNAIAERMKRQRAGISPDTENASKRRSDDLRFSEWEE